MHYFVTMLEQRVESFFRECRLSDQSDTQGDVLRRPRNLPNKKSACILGSIVELGMHALRIAIYGVTTQPWRTLEYSSCVWYVRPFVRTYEGAMISPVPSPGP